MNIQWYAFGRKLTIFENNLILIEFKIYLSFVTVIPDLGIYPIGKECMHIKKVCSSVILNNPM